MEGSESNTANSSSDAPKAKGDGFGGVGAREEAISVGDLKVCEVEVKEGCVEPEELDGVEVVVLGCVDEVGLGEMRNTESVEMGSSNLGTDDVIKSAESATDPAAMENSSEVSSTDPRKDGIGKETESAKNACCDQSDLDTASENFNSSSTNGMTEDVEPTISMKEKGGDTSIPDGIPMKDCEELVPAAEKDDSPSTLPPTRTEPQPRHFIPPIITVVPPTPVAGSEGSDVGSSNGVGVVATSKSTTPSIYLSDGVEQERRAVAEPKVQKRMTMAEKATREALAAFGGSGLESIPVRKVDLRSKLKRQAEKMKEEEKQGEGDVEGPPIKRPRTRLQAREEAGKASFGGTALGEGSKKKYPKVTMAKRNAKKSPPESTATESRTKTKVERSREKAIDLFGGASLDELPVKKKQPAHLYSWTRMNKKKSLGKAPPRLTGVTKRLTKAQKAQLEAIKSFGGNTLDNVLQGSKRKVAKTLDHSGVPAERKKKKKSGDESKDTSDGGSSDPDVVEEEVGSEEVSSTTSAAVREKENVMAT